MHVGPARCGPKTVRWCEGHRRWGLPSTTRCSNPREASCPRVRGGAEAVARIPQVTTQTDPSLTVLSVVSDPNVLAVWRGG